MDIGQIKNYFDYKLLRLFQSFCSTGQYTPVDEFTGIVMNGKVYPVVKSMDNHYKYINDNGQMTELPEDDSLYKWKNISGRHIKEYTRWYNTDKGAIAIGYTDVVTNMQDLYSRKMRVLDSENPDYGVGLEIESIPGDWTELRSYYFLHKDLRAIMDKIDITNATLDEIKKADAAFYESAKESYADMQDKLGKINVNTDEVETKLDNIDTNTDEVEVKLDEIDHNTDEVESTLSGIKEDTASININTDEIESSLSGIKGDTETIIADTDEVEEKLTNIENNTSKETDPSPEP